MKKLLLALAGIFLACPAHAASTFYSNSTTGDVGVGTASPINKLDIYGAAVIGTGYAGVRTAPANGLLVQGNAGIGTTMPVNALDIGTTGGIHIASGIPASTSMALYNNSGALIWNGVVLLNGSSVSGTTNYIPVFTGASSLGNSVIYQSGSSVGIGTTTPAYLLDVSGTGGSIGRFLSSTSGLAYLDVQNSNTGITSNGSIMRLITENAGGTGTASMDFIHYADGASYISNNETNAFAYTAFQIGGNERMRITSNGNVGIGTASPSQPLQVHVGTDENFSVRNNTSEVELFAENDINTAYEPLAISGSILSLNALGGSYVGIGTTNPAYKLDVTTGADGTASFTTAGATNRLRIVPQASQMYIDSVNFAQTAPEPLVFNGDTLTFETNNGNGVMYINTSGYVGIGSPSPTAFLDIRPSAPGSTIFLNVANGQNTAGSNNTAYIHTDQPFLSGSNLGTYTGAALEVTTYPNTNSANAGDVLKLGTSDLGGNSFTSYLEVKTATGNVGIANASPGYLLHVGNASIGTSTPVMALQNVAATCTFTPTASALTPSCTSDKRLKTDIKDSESALPRISDMRIRDFTVKVTGERRTGVIAQEMLPIHPDMVHKNGDGFYSVDEPNPWMMIKAIQELKADNDDLRSINAHQSKAIDDLRKDFETYKTKHP